MIQSDFLISSFVLYLLVVLQLKKKKKSFPFFPIDYMDSWNLSVQWVIVR